MMLSRKPKIFISLIAAIVLLLSGCSLPGLGGTSKNTITVGSLNTSESTTMAYIIKYLIEHETDQNAEIVGNMGSSIVQHQAQTQGEVDITSTRYTGTDLPGALKMDPVTDPDEALDIVQKEFEDQFDQTWFDPYGFANSYAFTVTSDLAEEEDLEKVSDIEDIAGELEFGVDNAWLNREGDGYEAFIEQYGFEFAKAYPMQIGLVYKAVDTGDMDVVLAYTTDGRIADFDLVPLEDDEQFFPPYDASLVANDDVLEENPELEGLLDNLAGTIDDEKMREMNYEADVQMKEPSLIAKEFLEEHNYFED